MEKQEGTLKAAAMKELRRQCPSFLIIQYGTAGAPDREIIGRGISTRWEFKHGTPDFISHDYQELFCMRLAVQTHCRYVVWQENKFGQCKRTMILHPRQVHERNGWDLVPEAFCVGFDHRWLVEQIRKAHGE